MNQLVISGRLTRDAVVRTAKNGNPYATFCVAVPDSWKREKTYFINCVAFGNVALSIEKNTGKGLRVIVKGSLETRDYTKRDGSKATATEVNVEQIEFIDFKPKEEEPPEEDEWDGGLF